MADTIRIALIAGSLRKGSYSLKAALALGRMAPANVETRLVEIGDLPHYCEDLETENPPASWVKFRREIAESDALLFVTPEYNRSVPGVLKNAVDVGSRPYGRAVWAGKPAAVLSISPGALGAFGANHHLRQSLMCLDVQMLQTPEAYVGNAASLFDEAGNLVSERTSDFFQAFMDRFIGWIGQLSAKN